MGGLDTELAQNVEVDMKPGFEVLVHCELSALRWSLLVGTLMWPKRGRNPQLLAPAEDPVRTNRVQHVYQLIVERVSLATKVQA